MQVLTQENIDSLLPYWKPETDVEYNNIVLSDWTIRPNKNFNNKQELTFKVLLVDGQTFNPPKEFSTTSYGFIKQVWPMIDRAQKEGRYELFISMKVTAKKYLLFDKAPMLRAQLHQEARHG